MSSSTKISWSDATWPIVSGCEYESPGCANCWAVRDSWRLAHNPNPKVHRAYFGTVDKRPDGKLVWSGVIRTLPDRLAWPLQWRKPRRIFACSMSDLFHPKVPFEFIAAAFGVMAMANWHTFQVLTKHARRMREFFAWLEQQQGGPLATCLWEARQAIGPELANRFDPYEDKLPEWPLENVWLGVTVEDQLRAEQRIPELKATPAAVRWLSVEPQLEEIDADLKGIDLVVNGGESAQTRKVTRVFDLSWARGMRDQARAAGAKYHLKQLGTRPVFPDEPNRVAFRPAGKSSRYKWHEPEHWPEDLRIQEFPA